MSGLLLRPFFCLRWLGVTRGTRGHVCAFFFCSSRKCAGVGVFSTPLVSERRGFPLTAPPASFFLFCFVSRVFVFFRVFCFLLAFCVCVHVFSLFSRRVPGTNVFFFFCSSKNLRHRGGCVFCQAICCFVRFFCRVFFGRANSEIFCLRRLVKWAVGVFCLYFYEKSMTSTEGIF